LMDGKTKPNKLWAIILNRFNKELCAIETKNAFAAASTKPKTPAKPRR
jgi:hypothetical protein